MSNRHIMISIDDESQFDNMRRTFEKLHRQYGLCIRRGYRGVAHFEQALFELALRRDQINRTEKQLLELLDVFGGTDGSRNKK